jgi:hypothetical protein
MLSSFAVIMLLLKSIRVKKLIRVNCKLTLIVLPALLTPEPLKYGYQINGIKSKANPRFPQESELNLFSTIFSQK